MKRLIFGKGKVSEIIKRDGDVILSREECNISSMEEVRGILKKNPSTIILNCAAKTNLEYCQDNKVETFLSNTKGVLNLIKISSDLNIKFAPKEISFKFRNDSFVGYITFDGEEIEWSDGDIWLKQVIKKLLLTVN